MPLNKGCPDAQVGSQKVVLIFFGMVASGKSTLGKRWAGIRNAPYYNTDRVRKELAGLHPTDRRPDAVGQGIYSAECSAKTYQRMLDQAQQDFAAGRTMVILDGSYSRREDRDQVRQRARKAGAECVFVWCACSDAEVSRRLALRERDPSTVSDGRWEIYLHQKQTFAVPAGEEAGDCLSLNTEQQLDGLIALLEAHPLLSRPA